MWATPERYHLAYGPTVEHGPTSDGVGSNQYGLSPSLTRKLRHAPVVIFRTLFLVVFGAMAIGVVVAVIRLNEEATPLEAELAALRWVGQGVAQEPRTDGDEWEVDVVRSDGSLIEVTIGDELELRGFDEERTGDGGPPPDELRGRVRARAIRAALAKTGPGRVLSVERESPREIEVGVRVEEGRQIEVELDRSLGVVEVEAEDPRDE